MNIIEIIQRKKEGLALTNEMISFVIQGYTSGEIPDYQMSSLLMAIYFKGMNDSEATSLALAMRDSGDVIDLSSIEGIKVDKHSTGGVGDKLSLIIAPLMAYFGLKFAKMSGRGLGHTGGTIDKLESIPGFKVERTKEAFMKQVRDHDIAIIGQSGDVAPADKKIYALRDVTATVDSIPLIAASVMSKKLASGAGIIVLDVKVGDGAFMKDIETAKKLAKLMVDIGSLADKKVIALLTNMDEPLGHYVGNAHEVYEAVETLLGKGPEDINVITSTISAQLLVASNIYSDYEIAYDASRLALKEGKAYSYLRRMVKDQEGDGDALYHMDTFFSKETHVIHAKSSGYIKKIHALAVGKAAMLLGAGRQKKDDVIDYSVGVYIHQKVGDKIKSGQPLFTLYHTNKGLTEAIELLEEAVVFSDKNVDISYIYDVIK
jgi:pyrimidine-nucleoside phosphorylase